MKKISRLLALSVLTVGGVVSLASCDDSTSSSVSSGGSEGSSETVSSAESDSSESTSSARAESSAGDPNGTHLRMWIAKADLDALTNLVTAYNTKYPQDTIYVTGIEMAEGDIGNNIGTDPNALPDVKQLMSMVIDEGKAVKKMISPTYKGPASLKNKKMIDAPAAFIEEDENGRGLSPIYEVNPRVLEVDSILDITRIKKVSGKEKRVFNDYEKWPCYIRADSIEQVVIAELQTIARFLDEEEDEFAAMLESKTNKDIATEQKIVESQLDTARARVKEIERLYERIYEDNVNGKVSDEWFMKLSHKYEVEMDETKKNILALREKLDSLAEKRQTKENFVKAVRSFMEMKTLTPVILRELIEKIEVYQIEGTGKNRTQRVVIHYRFVGCLQIPEWHRKRKVTLESRQGVAVNYLPTTA